MSVDAARRGSDRRRVGVVVVAVVVTLGALASGAGAATNLNNGAGTKAALSHPNCDPERDRIKFVYQGWVPCVKAWKDGADNGGATSQGVTKDSIAVVMYKQTDADQQASRSPVRNRATGALTTMDKALEDTQPMFDELYEQWGREIDVTIVTASGTDETAQRADAVKIAALKPFAVLNLAGGAVFASDLAKKRILVVGAPFPNRSAIAQAPYIWPVAIDTDTTALLGAELIGKTMVNKPAAFAGDPSLQSKKRVFGTVRPDSPSQPTFEAAYAELEKHGGKVAQDLTYVPPLDTAQIAPNAQEFAPTAISKLKNAGVTTILVLSPYQMTQAMTVAATAQNYFPEWFVMGAGTNDISILARLMDPQQWKHAFGVTGVWVPVADLTAGPSDVAFSWYWGSQAGNYSQGLFSLMDLLYAGIHMAGPKLTPQNFEAGMFSRPAVGGWAEDHITDSMRAFGKTAKLPYDEYLAGGDVAIVWWDGVTSGPSTATTAGPGTGVYQFVDNAKRFVRGEMPSKLPPFFDASASGTVYVVPTTPAAEKAPNYPCTGCPSAGGATRS